MKKLYLIIAVILCLGVFTSCKADNAEYDGTHTVNEGDVYLPTFEDYDEYLEYLQSQKLPEDFVHADKFSDLGKFTIAVFLDKPNKGYLYGFTDADENQIVINIKYLSSDDPKDIKQYRIENPPQNSAKDNYALYDYKSSLFPDDNLLRCNADANVVYVIIGDMAYRYLFGKLDLIQFIVNNKLYTINWMPLTVDNAHENDGSFLLETDNMVSKMIRYSTAADGYKEICARLESTSTSGSPTEPLQPLSPPVQPIEFDSLDDAIDFIKNNDLSKYREEEQIKYSEMNSVIKEINCLPVISFPNNNESRVDDFKIISVRLYPRAKYEDIGISYRFNYQGKDYSIIYYFF